MMSTTISQSAPGRDSSYFPVRSQHPANDKSSSSKANFFRFPATKGILWDQTPLGPSSLLHASHNRNIALQVSEAAVRLAHRHAQQAESHPHACFLVGSVTVEPDEEGLAITLDRFDPGRDVPGRTARLPTARLPGDFLVPLTVILGDADISATHSIHDFITAFKILDANCSSQGPADPANCLALRVLCRCHSNADDITFCLHFGAVTMATTFDAVPIKPIPIIPTALARNLTGPLSLSDVQGTYKTGYITMDETRKLLLLLESDPKTTTLPLVGIWLSGLTHLSNPVIWAACLRYANSSSIQERVYSSGGGFLLVMFTPTSRQPLFYECRVAGEQEPWFMLVGCRENLHVYKHASAKGKPPVEMELTQARSGPSKSLFLEALAQRGSQGNRPTPSHQHSRARSRRASTASTSSALSEEESQLVPRPSPKPILDKSPSVMPSVPELSFISDSFCDPSDFHIVSKVQHSPHQANQQQNRFTKVRPRLEAQSDPHSSFSLMHSKRQRLPGTSNSPPQGLEAHAGLKAGMVGHTRRPNRPGPLRTLNGQEMNAPRRQHPSFKPNEQYISPTGQRTTPGKGISLTPSRLSKSVQESGSKKGHMRTEKNPAQAVVGQGNPNRAHSSNRKNQHQIHSPLGNPSLQQVHPEDQHQQPETSNWGPESANAHSFNPVGNNGTPHGLSQKQQRAHSEPPIPHPSSKSNSSGRPSFATSQSHSQANVKVKGQMINGQRMVHPPTGSSEMPQMANLHLDKSHHPANPDPRRNSYSGTPQHKGLHPIGNTADSRGYAGSPHSAGSTHPNSPSFTPAMNGVIHHTDSMQTSSASDETTQGNETLERAIPSSEPDTPIDQASAMDSRTREQLNRQEEMIQQLQEQIQMLLQAQSGQHPGSPSLGLLTPPATPHGAHHTTSPPANQHSPPHPVQANQNTTCLCRTSPHDQAPPTASSHHRQAPPHSSSHHPVATPQCYSATPTNAGFTSNGHSSPMSHGQLKTMQTGYATQTTSVTTAQSIPSPLMCSMAVNTGQSLLWTNPQLNLNQNSPPQPFAQTTHPKGRKSRDYCSDQSNSDISTSTHVGSEGGSQIGRNNVPDVGRSEHTSPGLHPPVDKQSTSHLNTTDTSQMTAHTSHPRSHPHSPNSSPERSHNESSYTFGADLSSPTLGESASTYAPPRHPPESSDESSSGSSTEDEEEIREREDEEDMKHGDERREGARGGKPNEASPSLLYRDEQKFYDNLLGQVQQLLNPAGEDENGRDNETAPPSNLGDDHPRALQDVSMATMEELEKLGIHLHGGDVTIDERSLYRSLYNVSPDLHPRINYVSLADFSFDPTNMSMEANAIAMKYLSDSELTKLSAGFQGDKTPGKRPGGGVNPLLRSVLTGIREDGYAEASRGGSDSFAVNMSLASRKYMEKYGLVSGEGIADKPAETCSPRDDENLHQPSPVRFFKSPAIARTSLPTEDIEPGKRERKAKPTRLSYSPTHEAKPNAVRSVRDNANACNGRNEHVPCERQSHNVLGHLKAKTKRLEEEGSKSSDDDDSRSSGKILDISKLKQLPKLI